MIFNKPVAVSRTAPVADLYRLYASVRVSLVMCCISLTVTRHLPVAIRTSVVPVSTIPAVLERMVVEAPYRMDWLIPQ